jgi:hypothetical protein
LVFWYIFHRFDMLYHEKSGNLAFKAPLKMFSRHDSAVPAVFLIPVNLSINSGLRLNKLNVKFYWNSLSIQIRVHMFFYVRILRNSESARIIYKSSDKIWADSFRIESARKTIFPPKNCHPTPRRDSISRPITQYNTIARRSIIVSKYRRATHDVDDFQDAGGGLEGVDVDGGAHLDDREDLGERGKLLSVGAVALASAMARWRLRRIGGDSVPTNFFRPPSARQVRIPRDAPPSAATPRGGHFGVSSVSAPASIAFVCLCFPSA